MAALVGLGAALVGCGDPLTLGGWRGTPALIVRGAVTPPPDDDGSEPVLAVVWSPLGEAAASYPLRAADIREGEVGGFELALYAEPPRGAAGADDLPMAVGLLVLLDASTGVPDVVDSAALGVRARAVSGDHYVVWVDDADAVRARAGTHVLNPIALTDGYNLAVGVCRPGRPSQLQIVQAERVTLEPVAEPDRGDCLDVYWGAWR